MLLAAVFRVLHHAARALHPLQLLLAFLTPFDGQDTFQFFDGKFFDGSFIAHYTKTSRSLQRILYSSPDFVFWQISVLAS